MRSFAFTLVMLGCVPGDRTVRVADLEGAWWSDPAGPTADFAIHDGQIWLDYDSRYRPLRVEEGNVLVYELGPDLGKMERKIIEWRVDRLVLEDGAGRKTAYQRKKD